ESENGIESLIGNHDVLAFGIHGNSAGILQKQGGASDRQTGGDVSIIEDAPDANVVVQKIPSRDIAFQTTRVSRTNDCENNSLFGIHRHQPGVFCRFTGNDSKRSCISVSHSVKDTNGGYTAPAASASSCASSSTSRCLPAGS